MVHGAQSVRYRRLDLSPGDPILHLSQLLHVATIRLLPQLPEHQTCVLIAGCPTRLGHAVGMLSAVIEAQFHHIADIQL